MSIRRLNISHTISHFGDGVTWRSGASRVFRFPNTSDFALPQPSAIANQTKATDKGRKRIWKPVFCLHSLMKLCSWVLCKIALQQPNLWSLKGGIIFSTCSIGKITATVSSFSYPNYVINQKGRWGIQLYLSKLASDCPISNWTLQNEWGKLLWIILNVLEYLRTSLHRI